MKRFTFGLMLGTITFLVLAIVKPDLLVKLYFAFGATVMGWMLYDLLKN